jgi:hypothetical protein
MKIEGVIEFPNGIPIQFESLNQEFPIIISDVNGILSTPTSETDFNIGIHNLLKPQNSTIKNKNFMWGSIMAWPSGLSHMDACSIFFDVENEPDKIGQKICNSLGAWRKLLIENFSLLAERDLREPIISLTVNVGGAGQFSLFVNNGIDRKSFQPDDVISLAIYSKKTSYLGIDDIKNILCRTSKGESPKLSYYFLLDANRAISESNYRKSILDSATALEVCFSDVISEELNVTGKLKDYIFKKGDSLYKKRELLKALAIALPKTERDYQLDLESIRNKVIHSGYFPSRLEVIKGYNISKATIDDLIVNKFESKNKD